MSKSFNPFAPGGGRAAKKATASAPSEPEEPQTEETPEETTQSEETQEEKVPSGTTKEVLAWVGDDKDRAQLALDAEQKDNSPRKGLVRELEEVLEK